MEKHKSFSCNLVHISPDEQIGLHKQSTWELSYIVIGAGIRLIGDVSEPFKSGEVVLVPCEIPHCWFFDENTTDYRGKISNITLTFGQETLDNCVRSFPELSDSIAWILQVKKAIVFGREKLKLIVPILEKMVAESPVEQVPDFIRLLLLLAATESDHLIDCPREMSREEARLKQIEIFTICNAKRDITLDAIAGHVGMNRSSFCVFFKKATGKTYMNYLNEYRIRLACERLKKRQHSVSDICYEVGFNDVPYFNRVFRKMVGCSPTEYVKQ